MTDLSHRPLAFMPLGRLVHSTPYVAVETRRAPFGSISVLTDPRGATLIGAAALLRRGDQLLLTRESRYGARVQLVQTPGGGVDTGERPTEAAARELAEESGYRIHADTAVDLGAIHPYSPYVDARTHLYFFRDDAPAICDHGRELDEILWVPIAEAVAAAADGTLRCATTTTIILRAHTRGLLD